MPAARLPSSVFGSAAWIAQARVRPTTSAATVLIFVENVMAKLLPDAVQVFVAAKVHPLAHEHRRTAKLFQCVPSHLLVLASRFEYQRHTIIGAHEELIARQGDAGIDAPGAEIEPLLINQSAGLRIEDGENPIATDDVDQPDVNQMWKGEFSWRMLAGRNRVREAWGG